MIPIILLVSLFYYFTKVFIVKKFYAIACLFLFLLPTANAKEVITVMSIYGPSAAMAGFWRTVLNQANENQDKFQFILEPKPGAGGLLAIQEMDRSVNNKLAIISAPFVDLFERGRINKNDYVPISSSGDTCWVIMTPRGNIDQGLKSLSGETRLNLGTIGVGSSAHLTALLLAEQLNFEVEPIIFRSSVEGTILMATDESVHLQVDSPLNYQTFRERNPNIKALGTMCPVRNPKVPNVKTFKEQGFESVGVWSFVVANSKMPKSKQKELENILDQALVSIGQEKIFEAFDLFIPTLNGQTTTEHFNQNIGIVELNRNRFRKHLPQ